MATLITLLDGVIAANGSPTGLGATVGVALPTVDKFTADRGLLLIKAAVTASTVGSLTARLWLYHEASAAWYPAGIDASPANKGLINGGSAIGETGTDVIRHAEEVYGLTRIRRVYLELTAISNVTALTAWLDLVDDRGVV